MSATSTSATYAYQPDASVLNPIVPSLMDFDIDVRILSFNDELLMCPYSDTTFGQSCTVACSCANTCTCPTQCDLTCLCDSRGQNCL